MKDKIKKWLDKLATANKETFGTEPLDCCKVGREVKQINKTKKSK